MRITRATTRAISNTTTRTIIRTTIKPITKTTINMMLMEPIEGLHMTPILLIIVIVLLFGGLIHWGYRRNRRYDDPSRGLRLVRCLGILVVLFAVAAGIGYYRGWFHADSSDTNGHRTVTLTADKDKFNQDKDSARQAVQDLGHK
jgi:hypothetical protein